MKVSYALLNIIVGILTIQIALLPVSHALQVQLKTDIKLREHIDNSMERIGMLKAGTIVEIPDDYTVKGRNGKPNLDLTLNNWLRTGGSQRAADGAGAYSFDGEKTELFFPVRVVKPAPGSTVRKGHQNSDHFIALKFLARQGKALIVSDDALVEIAEEPEAPKKVAAPRVADPAMEMETDNPCSAGLCSQPSDASQPVRNLIAAIGPGLAAAAQRSRQLFQPEKNDLRAIYSNFRKSCGFDLGQFIPIINSRAEQAGIPTEIMLAILTKESAGQCHILNSETDKTQSVGVFQVNSASSNFPRCSSEQKNILRSLGSASRLATGPRCLENPLVNLGESIRILSDYKKLMVRNGFDPNQMSEDDLWRVSASAYNGGPKWPLQAKKDLEQFNELHGTSLSANNWEDLRIFYMREWLDRDQKAYAFGSTDRVQGRSREFSIVNLSYAETVIGRPVTGGQSLMAAWRPTVKDM